jgi:hypothetical protein
MLHWLAPGGSSMAHQTDACNVPPRPPPPPSPTWSNEKGAPAPAAKRSHMAAIITPQLLLSVCLGTPAMRQSARVRQAPPGLGSGWCTARN